MADHPVAGRTGARFLAIPEILVESYRVKRNGEKTAQPLAALGALMLFLGIGAATSYGLFDSPFPGALAGFGAYLLFMLFLMIWDLVAIKRELAAFRKGEDDD